MSGAACRDWKRAVATADIHSSRESPVSLDAAGRHVITDAKIPEVLGSHRAVPGRQHGVARPWRETRGWSSEEPAAPRLTRKDRRALGAPQGTDAWSQGGRRAHLPAVAGTKPSIAAHRHLRRQGSGKRSEGEVRPSDPLTSLVFSPTAASTPRSANGARGAPLADRSIDPPTHGRLCAATLLPARSSQEGQGFKDGSGEAVELQYYGTMRVQCVGTTFIVRYKSLAL